MIYTKCSACAFANCIVVHAVRVQKVTVMVVVTEVSASSSSSELIPCL